MSVQAVPSPNVEVLWNTIVLVAGFILGGGVGNSDISGFSGEKEKSLPQGGVPSTSSCTELRRNQAEADNSV